MAYARPERNIDPHTLPARYLWLRGRAIAADKEDGFKSQGKTKTHTS